MEEALFGFLAHPVRAAPYTAIRFSRRDHNRVPLFYVGNKEVGGALKSMRTAHDRYGSTCFYCGKPMAADIIGDVFTLDHVRAASLGGTDDLHNLVFCCRPCNERKGVQPLALFHPVRAADYAEAIERHLVRSLQALTGRADALGDKIGEGGVIAGSIG